MTEQKIEVGSFVLYKDKLTTVKSIAGNFYNIDWPHRENYFVPVSEVQLCDGDGVPVLSPSEGQQE